MNSSETAYRIFAKNGAEIRVPERLQRVMDELWLSGWREITTTPTQTEAA